MAAVVLLMAAAGCAHDSDYTPPTNEEALNNATEKLGVDIDPNQDWNMTASLEATITVALGLDQEYTVAVYDKNPLFNSDVHYYAKTQMAEGETTTLKLDVPSADSTFYVAVYDSKFRRLVQSATIDEGKLNVDFGNNGAEARTTRAAESDYTGTYAKTATDFLDGLTETEMAGYDAFTDADIDNNGFIFGTSTMNSRTKGPRKKTVHVEGEVYYKVPVGFNPTDGQTVEVTNNDGVVYGILTFHGSGSAAVANGNKWPCEAMLTRKAISFKANFAMSQAYFLMDGPWAQFNWTDNGTPVSQWGTTYDGENSYKNGDTNLSGMVQAGHTYKVWYTYNDLQFWGFKCYHQGDVTIDGEETPVKGSTKKYLVDTNTTITRPFHVTTSQMNGSVIYVKGKMHIGSNNTLNGVTIVVADGGEVILHSNTNLSTYGRFIVLPGGKISGDDGSTLTVANGAKCYNAGTIEYKGKLDTNGSEFYNCGTIKVNELDNKTTNGKLTNFGYIYIESNNSAANAHNSEVINGCYFKATGDVGLGKLKMLRSSRLDVGGQLYVPGNGLYGSARNEMEHLSVIKAASIKGNATCIYGPTANDEYAIVKVGSIYANNNTDFQTANNLYMDWNSDNLYYYDGSKVDQVNNTYMHGLVTNISKWTEESTSTYIIPAGDCSGAGYNPYGTSGNNGGFIGSPAVWTYAFEDTPLGDYDMNDVVIKVNVNAEDTTWLDVTLCCTGATFNLYVYLEDQMLFERSGQEVHNVFGQKPGSFINTINDGIKAEAVTASIQKPDNFSFETADFWIKTPYMEVHVAKQGEDPHGIRVPGDWKWPREWQCIKEAYPNFVEFAKDAGTTDKTIRKWYETTSTNPVMEYIYTPEE